MMRNKKAIRSPKPSGLRGLLFAVSLIFLAFGLFFLGWAMWPPGRDAVQIAIPAGVLPGAPSGTTYASLADMRLTVAWPRWVRLGQTGEIRVTLTEAQLPDAVAEGPAWFQTVVVEPMVFGMALDPPGLVQANLAEGQTLDLTWQASPLEAGTYPGKVIVAFGFYDQTAGALVEVPVAVVDISVRAVTLFGLEARLAVWFGMVGLVLWGALFVLGQTVGRGRRGAQKL
jgi:hypothetical protein